MPPAGISERATRKQRTDLALAAAGWRVVPHARWSAGGRTDADAVEEFPTDSGPAAYLGHFGFITINCCHVGMEYFREPSG